MDREIRFKRAFFYDEAKTKFSHFDTWGVNVDGANFKSPSSNNYAQYFTDCQFSSKKDKNGVDIYEVGVVKSFKKEYEDEPSINTVSFIRGCWRLVCNGKNDIPIFNYDSKELELIGNIYENPELLSQPLTV